MKPSQQINEAYRSLYHPVSAIVVYRQGEGHEAGHYIEHFDIDPMGRAINAHPLTVREAQRLSRALDTCAAGEKAFLSPEGILPACVLHIRTAGEGRVIWHTPAAQRHLHFTTDLAMPEGSAQVPPLLWCASRRALSLFALHSSKRPEGDTLLYHAPFPNVYEDGRVCMGNVTVELHRAASLESFIAGWERCFFGSYFNHALSRSLKTGSAVDLWRKRIGKDAPFPKSVLLETGRTLGKLLKASI